MAIPKGLKEAIQAFLKGCEANGQKADELSIALEMSDRLTVDFKSFESEWDKAKNQLLSIAGLSGRLAARYAELEGKSLIEWAHARKGLQDGKEECHDISGTRGKHCMSANFEEN